MPTTQASCAEDARLPNAESEVEIPDDVADAWPTARIGSFDVRIAFSESNEGTQAKNNRRVETLAAWLMMQWQTECKEAEHAECGTAD